MVAYSFRPRFAPLIVEGRKCQTIRGPRRRHARPGEEVQLFTGMRTRECRRLLNATCTAVLRTRLDFIGGLAVCLDGNWLSEGAAVDAFARADGFADVDDMRRFWAVEHPDIKVFDGVTIRWRFPISEPCP